MKRNLPWIAWTGLSLVVAGCTAGNPLEPLQRELDRFAEYSVILADMREGGYILDRLLAPVPGDHRPIGARL